MAGFVPLQYTMYPPSHPLLIWDGECGFCAYWKEYLEEKTSPRLHFNPYQEVSGNFPDIPEEHFKAAARLIDTEGKVYNGPDSFYKGLYYTKTENTFWHDRYHKSAWFRKLSDRFYIWIAANRPFLYRLTHFFFGKNPRQLKPYWLMYLAGILAIAAFLKILQG